MAAPVTSYMVGNISTTVASSVLGPEKTQKFIHVAITTTFTLLGIFGNVVLIAAFCLTKKLRTHTNTFILIVSLSDLTLILLMVSSKVATTVLQKRAVLVQTDTLCFSLTMVAYISYGVSMYGQGAIAVNRFLKICQTNFYHKVYTKRSVRIICIGIWLYSISLIFTIAFPGRCIFKFDGLICRIDAKEQTPCIYLVIVLGILLPTIVIFGLYFKIFMKIRETSRRALGESKTDAKSKKAIITLFTAFVLMVILFWPYAIIAAIDNNVRSQTVSTAMRYAVIWTYLSTGTNPIVYGIMNTTFREGYKNVLCCCCYRFKLKSGRFTIAESSTSSGTKTSKI